MEIQNQSGVERIIAVLDNNETAIIEHVQLGYNDGMQDTKHKFLPEESVLYVIKDSQKGELRHATEYELSGDNDYFKYYIGEKEKNTKLKPGYRFDEWDGEYHYPDYKEKRPIDDNATDEHSEIRNWFINNANGLQKKVNEESTK